MPVAFYLCISQLTIVKKIGEGVYGEVFQARHGPRDNVVLKVDSTVEFSSLLGAIGLLLLCCCVINIHKYKNSC